MTAPPSPTADAPADADRLFPAAEPNDAPTNSDNDPALPAVANPVPNSTAPEFPDFEDPVDRATTPDEPAEAASAEKTRTSPLDPEALEPDETVTVPAVELPATAPPKTVSVAP